MKQKTPNSKAHKLLVSGYMAMLWNRFAVLSETQTESCTGRQCHMT